MIFKQIDEILEGRKTQTRRVCKPNEYENNPSEPPGDCESVIIETLIPGTTGSVLRTKWQVGRTYAVVPKRGMPAVWWKRDEDAELGYLTARPYPEDRPGYLAHDWQPLRIRITAIRPQTLQDITEAEARAEGVASVAAYRDLWESINGRTPGARWADNPAVWVLTFELVR
jgi:hypothetical protein